MPWIWVSLGSNVDRTKNIRQAVSTLAKKFGALVSSHVYESHAVGFDGAPFYNLVVGFSTEFTPQMLVTEFRRIEQVQGRVRGSDKFAPRTLDMDLLTYGKQIVRLKNIKLPREEITRYAFVLGPLAEVAEQEIYPVTGQTYGELWRAFDRERQPMQLVDLDLPVSD